MSIQLLDTPNRHSPFRQHKTRDKHEIDRMTMTMAVEMPDSFTIELRSLLAGLLQRDVPKRLGCRGRGAEELKSHPFFRGIDWRVVFLQRLSPPLIPARGEVNAADAFDIGSFDEEDTKHIKLTDADQELYRNFPVVVSERWQHEIAETIFDYINHEADKAEMKRKNKHKLGYQEHEEQSDCILHGYIKRLGGTFTATWLTRYVRLYPNRLELWSDSGKQPELIFMDQIEEVCNDYVQIKNEQCIVIKLYNHSKYVFTNSDEIGLKEWHVSLKAAHKDSMDMMTTMAEKATKIYGTEIPLKHMGKRRQQLQQEASISLASAAGSSTSQQRGPTGPTTTIANLEQKIIQKELQASSSAASSSAAAAAAAAAAGLTSGPRAANASQQQAATTGTTGSSDAAARDKVENFDPQTASTRQGSGGSSASSSGQHQRPRSSGVRHAHSVRLGQSGENLLHKHHRSSVTTHGHHRHYHNRHEHLPTDGSIHYHRSHHHHHHHHHHGHASISSSSSVKHHYAKHQHQQQHQRQLPDQTQPNEADNKTTDVQQEVRSQAPLKKATFEEYNEKVLAADKVAQSATSSDTKDAMEIVAEDPAKKSQEPRELKGSGSEPEVREKNKKKDKRDSANSLDLSSTSSEASGSSSVSGSSSASGDSSASGSSADSADSIASGSSVGSTSGLEGLRQRQALEKATIAADSLETLVPKEPSTSSVAGDKSSILTSSAAASSGQAEAAMMLTPAAEPQRLKLAVSLENVSENQQEVLRDPSKRITSDNKQREQDLIAQYEKLNITARTSSSSIEEENNLA